jgi:hypothetical protein
MKSLFQVLIAAALTTIVVEGMAQEHTVGKPSVTSQNQASAPSKCEAIMAQAAAANKYVFILFWKDKGPQLDTAQTALKPAVINMANKAVFLSIWITNPEEKKIVNKYDVSRAPMPLVLAIAPSGAVTRAFAKTFDEKELHTAFVSPGKERCLKALQNRKLVFVCFLDKADPEVPFKAPKGVEDFKADEKFGPATEIVLVDAQDEREEALLKELRIGKDASKPKTVFLGPPGAVIGTFGDVPKDDFIARLTAAMSNSCGGGGCGPGGCGPKK